MDLGVWGVSIGISIASIAAGVGQVVALEIKSWTVAERIAAGVKVDAGGH
jgi:hypothetical protein